MKHESAPLNNGSNPVPVGASARPSIVPVRDGELSSIEGVEGSPLFSGLAPADYTRISAAGREKELARGQMLYVEGDPIKQVLLIHSGLAKCTKLGQNGTEVILRYCVPGDVLGILGLFSTKRHCTTGQAFRSCRATVWDGQTFKALVEAHPILHCNMVGVLNSYMLELEDRFREVATERVGPRVARQLVRLLKQLGRPVNGAIEVSLSREDLAQMTGTTLFTVSRLLSSWQARGLVIPRREAVTICDVGSLREISERD